METLGPHSFASTLKFLKLTARFGRTPVVPPTALPQKTIFDARNIVSPPLPRCWQAWPLAAHHLQAEQSLANFSARILTPSLRPRTSNKTIRFTQNTAKAEKSVGPKQLQWLGLRNDIRTKLTAKSRALSLGPLEINQFIPYGFRNST